MCGLIASYSEQNSAQKVYQGLLALQHRGQDAAGIACLSSKGLSLSLGLGPVHEVFAEHHFAKEPAVFALGHTRYSTSGGHRKEDSQPFYHEDGIALAHSGHLQQDTWMQAFRQGASSLVDSNLLLQFLAPHLKAIHDLDNEAYFAKLIELMRLIMQQIKGAYSVICLIAGKGLISFRDPQGIRPLVIAERLNSRQQKDYLLASESHFFQELGFHDYTEVEAGELVFINLQGQLVRQIIQQQQQRPCSFEYVYFAHPHSRLNGIKVADSRQAMGRLLAKQWQLNHAHLNPDFVLPIPKTASSAAQAFAEALNLTYGDYFIQDPSIGRSFIQADDDLRQTAVSKKLSIARDKIKDKKIILFDDSIVRGTTAKLIVEHLRALGVQAIYLVSACPPIRSICTKGINLPKRQELLAAQYKKEEIKNYLNVDELIYPSIEQLLSSLKPNTAQKAQACIRCMQV